MNIQPMYSFDTSKQDEKYELLKNKLHNAGLNRLQVNISVLTAQGQSNKEIANLTHVTERTVKYNLTLIYYKLKLKSRAQLIVTCLPYLDQDNQLNESETK
jgi:DNA-binding NarL/FixJ family response regulator